MYCKKNAKHKQRQGYHTAANQNHHLYHNGICLCNVANTVQTMPLSSISANNSPIGFTNNSSISGSLNIITDFSNGSTFSDKNKTYKDIFEYNNSNSLIANKETIQTRTLSTQAISLSSLIGFTNCVL